MYIYLQTEPGLWTVGHYNPSGDFVPESDWGSKSDAANRVHYLNGGIISFHHLDNEMRHAYY